MARNWWLLAGLAAGARAKQRVDDPVRPFEFFRQSPLVERAAHRTDRNVRLGENSVVFGGVAREFLRLGPE